MTTLTTLTILTLTLTNKSVSNCDVRVVAMFVVDLKPTKISVKNYF